jgi:hypothetical protein
MPLSVRLSPEEEALLDAASRRSARTKSQLVRQGVRELCLRLARPEKTAFEMGKGLFGVGTRSEEPSDPMKRAIKEKLRAKHGRLG